MQRFLQELAGQFEADKTAPPFLHIDSRVAPVRTPAEVSKALANVLSTDKIQKIEEYIGPSRFRSLLSLLEIKIKWSALIPILNGTLEAELAKDLKKDEGNLELTIEKYKHILEALKKMPKKPVLVIGMAQNLARKYISSKKIFIYLLPTLLEIFDVVCPLE